MLEKDPLFDGTIIHENTICFAYTGPALNEGKIDALLFAKSLESLRNLILESCNVIHGNSMQISVEIDANFAEGSFEWLITTKQRTVAVTKSLFTEHLALTLGVISILGFTADLTFNLIDVLRKTEGQPIQAVNVLPENNSIIIKCNGNELTIPIEVYKLLEDVPVRRSLENFIKPICNTGYDGLEVRENKRTIKRIDKQDFFIFRAPDKKQEIESHEYSGVFTIIAPHMLHGKKWRLKDDETGIERIYEILDKQFIDEVFYKKHPFTSGDKLFASVRVSTIETKKGTTTKYELLKMHQYITSQFREI